MLSARASHSLYSESKRSFVLGLPKAPVESCELSGVDSELFGRENSMASSRVLFSDVSKQIFGQCLKGEDFLLRGASCSNVRKKMTATVLTNSPSRFCYGVPEAQICS